MLYRFRRLFFTVLVLLSFLPLNLSLAQDVQDVSVPDANLAAAIRVVIGDSITTETMLNLTELNASGRSITDLTGLEYAQNLTTLDLASNSISDISPLSDLTNLTSLNIQENSISDISALKDLTNLTFLSLAGNSISDISALKDLTNLTDLYLALNSISDISALKDLTNLTLLTLGHNSISDISTLANLTKLTDLYLVEINTSDISVLADLTDLVELNLGGNSISDISALKDLTNLRDLGLSENSISDISALEDLTNLRELNLNDNSISDISALEDLTELRDLGLLGNSISDIPTLKDLTELIFLHLEENSISDISPLLSRAPIHSVYIERNPLSYASIYTHIPALEAEGFGVFFDYRDPTSLNPISGNGQVGSVNTALAAPFIVEVLDQNDTAFEGVPVTWSITSGAGRLSVTTTTADADGEAETRLTFGATPGVTTVSVKLADSVIGAEFVDPVEFTATANPGTPTNSPPVFPSNAAIPNISARVGVAITPVTLPAATDPDGDPITYSLTPGLPTGLAFNAATRRLSGTPTTASGTQVYTYTASDGTDTTALNFTITVNDSPVGTNSAPVFPPSAAISNISARVGVPITPVTLPEAADADGDTLTYSLTPGLPTGLAFNATTRRLSGTPTTVWDTLTYTYTASDGTDTTALAFTITVNDTPVATNNTPVFPANASISNISARVGITITPVTLPEAADADGDALTYSLTPGLPTGLAFNAATRRLSGTPTTVWDTLTYTYTASDGTDATTLTFTITVAANAAPVFPANADIANIDASEGITITPVTLPAATDADGDTITYSISPTLPAGLTLTGRVISGTPTAAMDATTYTWRATDGIDVTSLLFEITVAADTAPTFGGATIAPIVATVDTAIAPIFLPAATDAEGDTITYSISPTLPAGLTFNTATRLLSGTPTTPMAETSYTYTASTLRVSPEMVFIRLSAELTFTIEVIAVPVFIPDVNLHARIVETLGKSADAELTAEDMLELTILEAQNADIRDLAGLEHAHNLRELYLGNGDVAIAPEDAWLDNAMLEHAQNLRELDLENGDVAVATENVWINNTISDLSPLAGLTHLTYLSLDGNNISEVSPLAGLTQLTRLGLGYNDISDISPLAGLTHLTHLYLYRNGISDISRLAGLTHLTHLGLDGNSIWDVSRLASLTHLTRLGLGYNNDITDISPLAGLTHLTHLYLYRNSITDISRLAALTQLNWLLLSDNNISDISPLTALTHLEYLNLLNNPLSDASIDTHIPAIQAGGVAVVFGDAPDTEELVCQVGSILAPGESCFYPGTGTEFFVDPDGIASFLSFTSASSLNIRDIQVAGVSYTLVAQKLEDGSWIIQELGAPIDTETPVDKITGPWLWMIAPTPPGQGGFLSIDVDSLAEASDGLVTEAAVAVHSAFPGDPVGDLVWTLGEIAPTGSDNVNELVNRIGLATGDVNDHSIYGLITLESATYQSDVTVRVGSDDAIKVWLNGAVVHNNPIDRTAEDFQDAFTVDLVAGDNLLLVKVSEFIDHWALFVGINAEVNAVYKHPSETLTPTDVNGDGRVDIADLVLVVRSFGTTVVPGTIPNPDVNRNGVVDWPDLLLVVQVLASAADIAAAPMASVAYLQQWIDAAKRHHPDDATFEKGIAVLEQFLGTLQPEETALLANYPNPFNPETWIPYQLAKGTDVTVTIYDLQGAVVRRLMLGHQAAGIYHHRSRAAHWDGKNTVGEPVASGIYFYTLTAGDFTATRKLLIIK